ncbi:MAG TPA: hypothetical protein VNL14_02680 [Candidatus Acidoferrales bacterium]|nr:hypothetical protein [Candidatus Acidoferrales bacterium]
MTRRFALGLWRFVPTLALLMAAGGCAPLKPPGPERVLEPERLKQSLAERARDFRSLRSLATVSYRGAEGRGSFEEAVLVERPTRLRLETLSSLGAVAVVTANSSEITGLHPREGLFVRGKTTKSNLLRYTGIPLELSEITALLMGLPPVDVNAAWEISGNSMTRRLAGGGKETVSFDANLGIPVRWERAGPGDAGQLAAVFADFFSSPAGPFPLRVTFDARAQETRVEIRYREPEINVDLADSLFRQEKPANAREVPIESLQSR